MPALILPVAIAVWIWAFQRQGEWRDAVLKALVLFGFATALLTEGLGVFSAVKTRPLEATWICFAAGGLLYGIKVGPKVAAAQKKIFQGWIEWLLILAIAGITAMIGLVAVLSPPNSADAMAYHLPRVVYWAQAGNVAFFATPYLNQIMLQPLTEYVMLHTFVLSGGDRFVNLVQFLGFTGSIVGVSLVAKAFEVSRRGQMFAALFCATLPNGILQASGAKNDGLLALWLVCGVSFALSREIPWMALSIGLALFSKATAYLFLPPLLLAVLFCLRPRPREWIQIGATTVLAVLVINGPQYARNFDLSRSILGFDSAQGNGLFRWRNERLGWKPALSNLLRNTSEQLGTRRADWNAAVYDTVVRLHSLFGIDPQDPETTWHGSKYGPPNNANHESNANNRWHLLLLAAALVFAAYSAFRQRTITKRILFATGLLGGFLAFCFYLKWQPFLARLELPLFILSAPLAAFFWEAMRWRTLQLALCVLLLMNARSALFENWTRPLKGPHSLWHTSRELNYFNDMVQWNNLDSYLVAVDLFGKSHCPTVGIDISENQLEYPFQALLLRRNPTVRFIHTGVENVSRRYAPPHVVPCGVFCPDCAGIEAKRSLYDHFGAPIEIGRFWLFLPPY